MSGQVVMQGFIRRRIPLWGSGGLVTMIPAFVVIAIGLDPLRTLVITRSCSSFGIPFALIPLVMFTEQARDQGRPRQPPGSRSLRQP
jgi:manganese transport protein